MAPSAQFYYFNDRIVQANEAVLPLQDLSMFRGYAIFDYARTHKGKPLLLEQYLKRFRSSAQALRLPLKQSNEELSRIIGELIDRNGFTESGVRLLLTGGYSPDVFTPADPNLMIRIENSTLAPQAAYTEGVSLLTNEYLRDWPQVKHTNYLNAIRHWPRVSAAGATEILYYWQDEVLECSRSNFFIVKGGKLITSTTEYILAGITRAGVLALAREQGIKTEERIFSLEEVWQADEAFITGTTKRVMPVIKIDDRPIGNGKPGPVSQRLLQLWAAQVEG
ncbi:aminotransferase class IV [Cesiribacter sp. SM1]|uniref:aminotransferase class IV n=1 Tax=Cesiribacter sp. SM1 TaxID=2861196 RepID=UPI001CD4386A|nr:aminotransferase class IV [Cesiribacter sp. SM1]